MDQFASNLIRTLGGTTAVATMIEAPVSTVHSWKRIGIPPSRLAHLKLAAAGASVDWDSGLRPGETQPERDAEVLVPFDRRSDLAIEPEPARKAG